MEAGIHELTAAYALDALDTDERRAYELHLRECERCRDELASMWQTTDALAVAASGPAPSPEVRSRIVSAARAEPQVVVPFEQRRRRATPVLATAAAVAAVVAVALGLWSAQLSGDLDEARSALEQQQATAAVLADPSARTVDLEAGEGRLLVAADGRAVLVLDGIDPAPTGKTYELWVLEGDVAVPAGLFPGSEGTEIVGLGRPVDEGNRVAVTLEDEGGVDEPTLPPIAASEPV